MPASSAGQPWWKGHSIKQPGPVRVQGANRQSWESCHGVQTSSTLRGNIPCTVHKQGKLRVSAQSLPDVPHREQNSPECPRGEHQTRHLTGNTSHLYNKALLSNEIITRQGLKSLFNGISLQKNSFILCPWYSLLCNNLVTACPTATIAHECAGKQLAQVREFTMKIKVIFMHVAVLATSER